MTIEEYKNLFLKKYGCNSLSEFIDVYLDFELAYDILIEYFILLSYVKNLENQILNRKE